MFTYTKCFEMPHESKGKDPNLATHYNKTESGCIFEQNHVIKWVESLRNEPEPHTESLTQRQRQNELNRFLKRDFLKSDAFLLSNLPRFYFFNEPWPNNVSIFTLSLFD